MHKIDPMAEDGVAEGWRSGASDMAADQGCQNSNNAPGRVLGVAGLAQFRHFTWNGDKSALLLAAMEGHADIIADLLDGGANIEALCRVRLRWPVSAARPCPRSFTLLTLA